MSQSAPTLAAPTGLLRRLWRSPMAAGSLAVLCVVVLGALAAPLLTPYSPDSGSISDALLGAGGAHPLGTDSAGRDILSRLLFGARTTLGGAALALAVAAVVGVTAGLLAGFYGRATDLAVEWANGFIMALPAVMILLAVRAAFGNVLWLSMTVLGICLAPGFARLTRTIVVGVRHELYVDAARVSGLSDGRIIFKHVLNAVRAPIIIHAALTGVVAIGIESGLEFLGLADTSVAAWGTMLNEALVNLYVAPGLMLWPGVALGVVNAALILFGNGLRDVLEDRPAAGRKRPRRQAPSPTADTPEPQTADGGSLLSVRGLRIGYQNAQGMSEVVRGVDLDLRRGEVLGLVGESGSGKTQTAWAILDLLPREAHVLGGTFTLEDGDLGRLSTAARRALLGKKIGYVPQEPMSNLDPAFTIGSQLTGPMRRHLRLSKAHAKDKALALLDRVGIPDPERTFRAYPHQISGGMAQRVLIAGAVSCEPEILIADEPTTALDVTVQAEVLDLLRDLQQERGMAVLLVTHNFGVVADLCDRVAVMQHGAIVETGAVAQIFADPAHSYTKMLLGSLLHGREPRTRLLTPLASQGIEGGAG